jgi:hypothetical protein
MADLSGFDANTVDPAVGFPPIPEGDYVAAIVGSETKPTKQNDENGHPRGSHLDLTFEILEGGYKGRKLWVCLNLNNPSQQAVDIAHAELSAVCRAVAVLTPADSSELHDRPLTIQVVQRPWTTAGGEKRVSNEIKRYSSACDSVSPPSTGDKAPWE